MSDSENSSELGSLRGSSSLGCSVTESDDIGPAVYDESAAGETCSSNTGIAVEGTNSLSSKTVDESETGGHSFSSISENFYSNSISTLFIDKSLALHETNSHSEALESSESITIHENSNDAPPTTSRAIEVGNREIMFTEEVGPLQKRLEQALALYFSSGITYAVHEFYTVGAYTFVQVTREGAPNLKTLILRCQNFEGDSIIAERAIAIRPEGVRAFREKGYKIADEAFLCLDWETRL